MDCEAPADLVVEGGAVLTVDDHNRIFTDGHVAIADGEILAVGTGSYPGERGKATVIDARGGVIMPGLVDSHYHISLAKGYCDNVPLAVAIADCWYPLTRNLDPEAAYWGAMASYADSLCRGVTTVNDMYSQIGARAEAARDIGIRAMLCCETTAGEHGLATLEENYAAYRRFHGTADGRVTITLGLESVNATDEALLREAGELADLIGTGVHIHLSESTDEVAICHSRHRRTPVRVAYDHALLRPGTVAAHCVHLTEDDVRLLAETGASVAHNPTSNARLAVGVAPLRDLLDAGVNVALGHDSADCSNSRDMFEVMRFTTLVHRAVHADTRLFSPTEVLPLATRAGADALRLDVGVLRPGADADVIVVHTGGLGFVPLVPDVLVSHLALGNPSAAVTTVIDAGSLVVRDGEFLTADLGEIAREATRAFKCLVKQTGVRPL